MTVYVPEWLLWTIAGVIGMPVAFVLILCIMLYIAHKRN